MNGYYLVIAKDSENQKITCLNIKLNEYQLQIQSPWNSFVSYLNLNDILYIKSPTRSINQDSIFVINPQHPIPVTTVVEAQSCPRKVYLSHIGADILDEDNFVASRAVEGNLVHSLFSHRISHSTSFEDSIKATLKNSKVELVLADYSKEKALAYLENTGTVLQNFNFKGETEISIENVQFGLLGKLDALTSTKRIIELKTSRIPDYAPWPSHNIQVNMYLSLLDDPEYKALVLYVNDGQVGIKHPTEWSLSDTILARNWAYLVAVDRFQPPVLQGDDQSTCRSCYQKNSCYRICASFNNQRTCEECYHEPICPKNEIPDYLQEYVNRLIHALIFEELESESKDLRYFKEFTNVYTKSPVQQSISTTLAKHTGNSDLIKKEENWDEESQSYFTVYVHNFDKSEFRSGDIVSLSNKSQNEENIQIRFISSARIKEVNDTDIVLVSESPLPEHAEIREGSNYSIFKRRKEAVMSAIFNKMNVIEPWVKSFNYKLNDSKFHEIMKTSIQPFQISSPLKSYNPHQLIAIAKSLQNSDFSLIQGPAGTGKTSVVVEIAKQLILEKKSVLISAFTNMAVDNIGLQLHKHNIPFLRLGSPLSTNESLHPYLLENNEEIYRRIVEKSDAHIVIATTSTIGSKNYRELYFDYVILDEAAQMTEPDTLIALNHGKNFTLVGDHAQLPAVVISDQAVELGLQIPLFQKLVSNYPEHHVLLKFQYRMNEEILRFPNVMFYDNELQSATEEIASQMLVENSGWNNSNQGITRHLPYYIVNLKVSRSYVNQTPKMNQLEIEACKLIIDELLNRYYLESSQIGIIAPFRLQVAKLREELQQIKIDTIDRFQGSESDVIIFTTTTTSPIPILTDARRFNVALTRAKKLLVILITNTHREIENELLARLYKDALQRNRVVNFQL